jgi:ParB family chromosome partitioning protein
MSKKGGLGRGLDSLLPSASSNHDEETSYFLCSVDSIFPNPYQPRKEFDAAGLDELANSIREKGVIQPLIVHREDGKQGSYFLIAGERRWRASKMAGLTEVPVIVKDATSEDLLELALIENIQRQDLNPIEEAEAYQKLTSGFGLTQGETAKRVGKMRTTVANMLRLLKLPQYIKNDITQGKITAGHARTLLCAIDDADALKKLRDEIIDQSLSVRQTERLLKEYKEKGQKPARSARKSAGSIARPYSRALANALHSYLGSPAKIIQRGARGKIVVEYLSPKDLERIMGLIIRGQEQTCQ